MQCRTRLKPMDVGLPRGSRRRVRGLRRGEVAELVGVSVYWYRALESVRAARVSPQLVVRLADVLRLTLAERIALVRLSLPEMYLLLAGLGSGNAEVTLTRSLPIGAVRS
jgi:transcriptional regulator with XRE-family HTH domain